MNNNTVILSRDCSGILIPIGTEVNLKKGSEVTVTQALGGTATVTHEGHLVRISSDNMDALNLESEFPSVQNEDNSHDKNIDLNLVWDQLRTCYDPEIPINIVELGLIYKCELVKKDDLEILEIEMTLTAPGCGMGPFLVEDVHHKVSGVPNVKEVRVELVFDPPWRPDMMSDEARLEAGLY